MAVKKRKTKVREAQLAFEVLSIEGGLLSPEWLSKVASLQAGTQTDADYGIEKGLNLRDEIGRYWRIAQALWAEFYVGRKGGADPKSNADRFVTSLLRKVFDFKSLVAVPDAVLHERGYPIGHAGLGGRVPVVVAPADSGLDTLSLAFGDGARRRSAFGLAQEYLNAQDGALWGIASDGCSLRIVRDNASLTRPAWIEADLQRLFTEERYADFTALWLLCHETRFGREGQPVTECALEAWRSAGREEGTRAREHLRRGVEDALVALGQGFLSHAENGALRAELHNGTLSVKDYFNQLLRLVYRLIFLLTVEERGLLHPDGTSDVTKALYANGYGIRRLRERSVKRSAHDRFSDLWDATKVVCRGLATGEPRLGLPALAGIFAANQCAALDGAKLENRALLLAVFKLAWLREDGSLSRVNWRDMGPEELGSVYESLLELVPQIAKDGRQFVFATGDETKGNARKTTGSYYTPDSLVQVLLDSALEPVIADTIAKNPGNAVDALLGLSIVDPACGSGHFLLAAARRLAAHVARLQANGTPSAAEYRHALRQVVGRCIFGVDLNPMAVELCKVGLWMEAVEPGLPLTFLNSHIQHGNALLGTTPELMAKGVPDAAWDPIEGDNKKTASALKKRNKKYADDKQDSFGFLTATSATETRQITKEVASLDSESDATLDAVKAKESHWERIQGLPEWQHQKLVADAWCSAFVWPKQESTALAAPTNEIWRALRNATSQLSLLTTTVQMLTTQYRFFHWHLQFPQVFAKGGFDVVLGNPPWERVKLQEQEFFASRSEEIAMAVNAAARKKLIAKLPEENPQLWQEWSAASRKSEGESHSIRQSGRYPLCGKGDVNTYAIFAEHNRRALGPRGRAGFIVPTGLATDDTTKAYFQTILENGQLQSLFDFQTSADTFGNLAHGAMRFCLLTLRSLAALDPVDLVFLAKTPTDLLVRERHVALSAGDFALLNPNTKTCPTFSSRRDADINLAMYRRAGVLWRESDEERGNPWNLQFLRMFDMANDSGLFKTRPEMESAQARLDGNRFVGGREIYLPLVEAKMVDHFDHRYASLIGVEHGSGRISRKLVGWYSARGEDPEELAQPQYWISEERVSERLSGRWDRGWLMGWRDICRSTDQRTVISSLIPRSAVGDKFLLILPGVEPRLAACLYASLCSFPLDYAARQKVGGTSLKYFTMRQLPVLRPDTYEAAAPWDGGTMLRDWIVPRVVELTYTALDLRSFARDVGFDIPPFEWRPHRRHELRCELDAAFFRLYGLSKDDVAHVMETFPIVRRNEDKANDGVYRTKETILSIYEELVAAERSGTAYRTRLSPPPADASITHGVPGGGKVLPFRPAVRAQPAIQPTAATPDPRRDIPAWTPALLPAVATKIGLAASAGRWGITLTGVDLGIAALAAVLRNVGGPASRDEVERAVVLSVLPGLLQSRFDAETAPKWRRAVGTANMNLSSIAALSIPWAEVLHRSVVERLLEIDEDACWRAGADIADAPSAELDARALVALSWLESVNSSGVEDTELVTQLGLLRVA